MLQFLNILKKEGISIDSMKFHEIIRHNKDEEVNERSFTCIAKIHCFKCATPS